MSMNQISIESLARIFDEYVKSEIGQWPVSDLYANSAYVMQVSGKRLRPHLLLLAYGISNQKIDDALPAAFAIEIFHNFTLAHDDIMDAAELRRGRLTLYRHKGINEAILAGDAMMIMAIKYLSGSEKILNKKGAVEYFLKTALAVCEGQQSDLAFEKNPNVSLAEYLEMIRKKTAILPAEALRIGAILGGEKPETCQALYSFGENLGMAFQIQDDYLDCFGNSQKVGKVIGGDIRQNKKTVVLLKAKEVADKSTWKNIINHYGQEEDGAVAKVISLFRQLGVEKMVEKMRDKFHEDSLIALENCDISNSIKSELINFSKNLLKREN